MESDINIVVLSGREFEIMQLVSLGKSNKEIADNLRCMEPTVKKHMQRIFPKLGAHNRTQATVKFLEITGRITLSEN